jgi:DNA-directed RNA polymerase subunit RPC12/RpoP
MPSQDNEDLEEKKLLGSGGHAIAKLTEDEELKVNVGVPHLFLGNIGRLNEDRFLRYYCNKCGKEYPGCPLITYENTNEDVGQDNIILVEKGEYKCRNCNNTIAHYRKFNK